MQVVGSTYCLVQKSIDGGGCCNDTKINTLLLINQGWEGVIKSSNYSTLLNLITSCVARGIINNFRFKIELAFGGKRETQRGERKKNFD